MRKTLITTLLLMAFIMPLNTVYAATDLSPWLTQETLPGDYYPYYNEYSVTHLAKMLYGEGGATTEQKAAACYTVFWHYEDGAGPLLHIIKSWYYGYHTKHPVTEENYNIAKDTYIRYDMYKCGYTIEECGIVLPTNYKYFNGDGKNNHFRNHWQSSKATRWQWTLPSPY